MSWPKCYLKSSVGKKHLMGISGLLLCGFLVTHLLGNLLIIVSPEAFNTYAYKLITNPLIIPMEIGLFLLFFSHIALGIRLTIENRMARCNRYAIKVPTGRGETFASRTMPLTGLVVLAFLLYHVVTFRFGAYYPVTYSGVEMRDLHRLVMESFSSLPVVLFYVFAVLSLGIHVSHGFASCFQSLGFNHPKYTPKLKCLSLLYAIFITVGFSTLPIWAYLQGGK